MANCCLLSNGCPKIDTLLSGMDSDLAELFCVYRGLLWYPSMPWSWSSLMAKGTGSYVPSGSEWCHPLGADRQLRVQKQAAIALPLLMDYWIIGSGNVRITIFLSKSAWRRTTKHSLFSLWQSKMVWVIVSHELCGEVSLVEVLQSLIAAERKRTFVN